MVHLSALGWNSYFQEHWKSIAQPGWEPARVAEQQKESYRIVGEAGEMTAEITASVQMARCGVRFAECNLPR